MIRTNGKVWLCVALPFACVVQGGIYDAWKQHEYCNDLKHIDSTRIEPLTPEEQKQVESLLQVQILARHGSRAPYGRVFCWDEKKNNPMNVRWNCSTTSVSSQNIADKSSASGYGRLFRKQYTNGLNILKGDCVVGGILPEGREQHAANGLYLREAYIGPSPFHLFDTANISKVDTRHIYLRSDDQERTLGSGQVLFDAFFPPDASESTLLDDLLTWRVADYSTDHINANENICPIMRYIADLSSTSKTFHDHITSLPVVELEERFTASVGNFSWNTVLECLSVARCNNLPLPNGVDGALFTKIYQEVEFRQGLFLTYNDSWYSKVAMQPLFRDMINNLDDAIAKEQDYAKLAIFMGHDATLMPFLAALQRENWNRSWTPYAAAFVLELYKTTSGHAVRPLYRGKPIKIPECQNSLCDVETFVKALNYARSPRNCNQPKTGVVASSSHRVWYRYFAPFILAILIVFSAMVVFRSRNRTRSSEQETLLSPS
uniref:Uncharacterized protein AlNc14C18G1887 n=1 Tax=Albugo laibachii Nc14 TaxID=890382 RepID=F0W4R6_9STRA|nr:conserved hypothetical protein [Albugo laibachii Nc14]|eukprot:CCA16101.1 conserved hypothetical protein [Albugo laibachii Nc14]